METERARVDELAATDDFILSGEGTRRNRDPDGKALAEIMAEAGWPGSSNIHFRALERKLAAARQLLGQERERGARQERERIVEWLRKYNPAEGAPHDGAVISIYEDFGPDDAADAIEREFAAPPERERTE